MGQRRMNGRLVDGGAQRGRVLETEIEFGVREESKESRTPSRARAAWAGPVVMRAGGERESGWNGWMEAPVAESR